MKMIIIGNAIFLVGCTINVLIGLIKDKKKVLIYQCAQFTLMGIGNLFLNGLSGFIANTVSIVRNVYSLKKDYTDKVKYFFVIIQGAITLLFNNEGLVGLLPLLAVCTYSFFLAEDDPKKFRLILIITQSMWIVYDIIHYNVVSTIFGILTIITCSITLYRFIKEEKK